MHSPAACTGCAGTGSRYARPYPMARPAKVTRILHSQGLNASKYSRLSEMAVLCGQVRSDAWRRCSGVSTVRQSPYDVRDDWMAEGYDWHGLPARLGKAMLSDALGDMAAAREAAQVKVKRAIRHRTRNDDAERKRLYSLLKRNLWTEDPFLHRQMRKRWKGGRSHVTNQIVADSGSYTTKVWKGRAWVYLQGMERGQRIAIPLKGTHLPSGTLRIILQPNGQVSVHYAVDENEVCSTRPCGDATVGVDKGYTEAYTDSDGERHGQGLGDLLAAESDHQKVKGQRRNHLRSMAEKHEAKGHHRKADNIRQHNLGRNKWNRRKRQHKKRARNHLCQAAHAVVDKADTIACEDLTVPMKSAPYRHRDTNRRLHGWVKGVMADTLTSISRRRGSAPALVNPAYTSQIDSRTGLLQGRRHWDRFHCIDGVVLDADTNAACNILARLYDDEITLYTPFREVKALLVERTRLSVGT
ncbi:MAG: transposase, partial [Caldilineaceae bacterium SB0666_bin_21]|nr:transposase [Caldilineaceae bacterium SB0666_bin_21]